MKDVQKVWTRLLSVQVLTFESRSAAAANTGWSGSGKGKVRVEQIEPDVILFHEQGAWTSNEGRETTFTNVFRWSAEADGGSIRLEHLRFGKNQPVYLFDLVPVDEGVLASSEPHVCRDDLYEARLEFDAKAVQLRWTVNGPQKAETIAYTYK